MLLKRQSAGSSTRASRAATPRSPLRFSSMFQHVPIALAVQLASLLLGRSLGVSHAASLWLGCFAACGVCIMREITQREYQWIEAHGGGRRRNMPLLAGLRFWEWNGHSKRETIAACAAVILVALGFPAMGWA